MDQGHPNGVKVIQMDQGYPNGSRSYKWGQGHTHRSRSANDKMKHEGEWKDKNGEINNENNSGNHDQIGRTSPLCWLSSSSHACGWLSRRQTTRSSSWFHSCVD
jgi:hypothetical protein